MHLGELEIIGIRSATRQDLYAVVRLAEAGELQSAVTQELPLAQANEALAAVTAGSVLGRLVLVPWPSPPDGLDAREPWTWQRAVEGFAVIREQPNSRTLYGGRT